MEFIRKNRLWDFSYFLSNPGCFFYRFGDGGFKNKWTGLWHGETKFLEFLAFMDRGEWLSEHSCRELSYDGLRAVHEFRVPGNVIMQSLFIPGTDHLVVDVSSKKPMELEFLAAVNIRKRTENRARRQYSISSGKGRIAVSNDLGSLTIRGPEGMSFREQREYREHWPSGESQGYFLPGMISVSGKSARFIISPSLNGKGHAGIGDIKGSLRIREDSLSGLRGLIKSDNMDLESGFYWSAVATDLCRKRGPGLVSWYAGLPWFQQFWARDVLWVTPSLVSLGFLDEVRDTLGFFARHSKGGRVPGLVSESEGKQMNSVDSTLLWIISLDNYVFHSGDRRFLGRMRPFLESGLGFLVSRDSDGDGYIEHDSDFPETWMDTLNRGNNAVEVQALYCKALDSGFRLLGILPGKGSGLVHDIERRRDKVRGSFERDFFRDGFYIDRFLQKKPITVKTANALVPSLCGMNGHDKDLLSVIESEAFTTKAGVRTRASGEDGFAPGGYHTGSVWSLTTAWASAAEFLAGRPERGWDYLRILLGDTGRDALGCIGECWDSSSLELRGCPMQLWGSGFVPRIVDEFMLGIAVDCFKKTISVRPRLPPSINRVERVIYTGLGKARLRFARKGGKIHSTLSGNRFRLNES